ncbi:MAG: ABC transporter ATP-binding protein [Planctomycetes bacterium]|nr:ABC transporter ATP-binding protein [Planctomycetota bacterium]
MGPVRGERQEPPVLEVEGLTTVFETDRGRAVAVDGVGLRVRRGETLAVVGESGCGKSVTALSILRLLATPPARIVAGSVRLGGVDLLALGEARMREVRGNRVAMVFQEPHTSLNPVQRVGAQVAEVLRIHRGLGRREAWRRAVEGLARVGVPEAARSARAYPHELSGGQKQRVMIAMALACDPEVLIADEPTTALDVTIQAQVLDLLASLRRERGMALVLITHDLGVVAEVADRVAVMYAGQVVEEAPREAFFRGPLHPYSRALFASRPGAGSVRGRLVPIPGMVPDATAWPAGCRFEPRCACAEAACRGTPQRLVEAAGGAGHRVACAVVAPPGGGGA